MQNLKRDWTDQVYKALEGALKRGLAEDLSEILARDFERGLQGAYAKGLADAKPTPTKPKVIVGISRTKRSPNRDPKRRR